MPGAPAHESEQRLAVAATIEIEDLAIAILP
jgi:hypothetical protein